jgi:hypothetical protein
MSVEKLRTLQEASRVSRLAAGDPQLLRRLRQLFHLAQHLAPFPAPRGLQKFRNLAEAQQARSAWQRQRAQVLSARVGRQG